MAKTKPTIKKPATPVAAKSTPVARNRGAVLIKVTATKLRDLIGADTEIGVSRKELKVLLLKSKASDVLAEAGL